MIITIRQCVAMSGFTVALGLASAGCTQPIDGPERASSESQDLYLLGSTWPNGVVPVCYDTNDGNNSTLLAQAQTLLADSWSQAAKVTFTGWGPCNYQHTSSSPAKQASIHFKAGVNGLTTGHSPTCFPANVCGPGGSDVTLISDDSDPFQQKFRYEVIHEFGHVLGFAHEQERPDNFAGPNIPLYCAQYDTTRFDAAAPLTGGTYETTFFDTQSIMDYCSSDPFNGGFVTSLSSGDIQGVRKVPAYGRNTAAHGFMLPNGAAIGYMWAGAATQGTNVTMSTTCTVSDPTCTWTYQRGMLVSDADPTLAINAWGGAAEGTVLRLNSACTPTNPNCTFTWKKGEFLSDSNQALAINASGGAKNGATMKLAGACRPTNTDCTWYMISVLLSSIRNTSLSINAWGGATNGQNVKLNTACTAANPDCTWSFVPDGRILSTHDITLGLNAWGGANDGIFVKPNSACSSSNTSNPDCTWTWSHGQIISDNLARGTFPINAVGGALQAANIELESACTATNPDCVFSGLFGK